MIQTIAGSRGGSLGASARADRVVAGRAPAATRRDGRLAAFGVDQQREARAVARHPGQRRSKPACSSSPAGPIPDARSATVGQVFDPGAERVAAGEFERNSRPPVRAWCARRERGDRPAIRQVVEQAAAPQFEALAVAEPRQHPRHPAGDDVQRPRGDRAARGRTRARWRRRRSARNARVGRDHPGPSRDRGTRRSQSTRFGVAWPPAPSGCAGLQADLVRCCWASGDCSAHCSTAHGTVPTSARLRVSQSHSTVSKSPG